MTLLSPPYALGAAGQVLSGKLLRLTNGGPYRPGASGVLGVSGCLVGPPNTMGELSLPNNTSVLVQPFRAVIQSNQDLTTGQWMAINDAAVSLALPAQDASQWRRGLVVVRVADSQVAGVASSPTTDRAVLEVVAGALAASQGAAVLPGAQINGLALGEVLIPPTGQAVTLTPYNPRTGTRGGILPVVNDASTVAGHGGAPGAYVNEFRAHPTRGLERWNGTAWVEGDTDWQPLAINAPVVAGPDLCSYRIIGREFHFQCHLTFNGSWGAAFTVFTVTGIQVSRAHYFHARKYLPTGSADFFIKPAVGYVALQIDEAFSAGGVVVSGVVPLAVPTA